MSHKVVKILSGDDYEERESPVWCYVTTVNGDSATLCHGEVFGFGVSACKYEVDIVEAGGITCPDCLEIIKKIKAIDLGN